MKKKLLYLFYFLLFFLPATLMAQTATHVVISEIYGGGGNSGATYLNDFIELYNPTNADVDLTGWSIQYASATGPTPTVTSSNWSGLTPIPSGVIKAHGYFLIAETSGGANGIALPTPDFTPTGTASINFSATTGKIALCKTSDVLAGVPLVSSANVVDLVGFGATTNYGEGWVTGAAITTYAAPAPSATTSIERKTSATSTATTMAAGGSEDLKGNGWDSDNNANDFFVPSVINPQNSASPIEPALGAATPTLTTSVSSLDFGTTTNVSSSATKTFTVSGANLTAGASLALSGAGAGQYAISTDGTTFGPTATIASAFTSAQTVTVKFTPSGTTAAVASIGITSTNAAQQNVSLTGTGVAVAATPALTTSVSSLDFGTTTSVGGSATKTFTVSGANLTAGATLTATGTGYSVSTDGTTFGPTATIAAAFTAAQTITVKFTPAGTTLSTGNIAIASTNAATQNVSLTGSGVSASATTLTVTPTLLDFGTAQPTNTPSAAKSFTIAGTNIGSGGVTVTVATPFSIAATAAGTYGASLTLTQAQMATTQTVYVEFTPTTTAAANVNLSVVSGTATQTVALTGAGVTASSGGGTGSGHVVISQIYASNGGTYDYDWIELYNPTSTPVDISGWSVQYNSATGTGIYSGITPFPTGSTIKAHGYFMIQEQGAANTTSTFVPTPDIATSGTLFGAGSVNFNMSGAGGKVALVNNSTFIPTKPTLPDPTIIDLIGYGTANYFEGSTAAPAPSGTTTLQRKANASSTAITMSTGGTDAAAGNGYDTDDNGGNFVAQATPNPHNSASPVAPATGVAAGPTLTVTPATLTFSQLINTTSPAQTVTITGTTLTTSVTITVALPYSISTSVSGTYGQQLTLTSTQVASGMPIYIEFMPTAAGAANGTLSFASASATTQTVTLNGSGLSSLTPTLTTSVSSLDFGTTTGIGFSATKTFTLSGANLTAGASLAVTGAGYTISTDGTTFGPTATIASAFTAAQTITVKFTPTVTTAATGSIAITSTSATTTTVTLTGTGVQLPNTVPTLGVISDIVGCYGNIPPTIALTGITPGTEASQTVILSVTATNPALFSQLGIFPIVGGTTGQINLTIAPNASGTSAVTVTVKDNGGTANGGVDTYTRTFNITVNALPNVSITSNVGTNITKGVTAQLTATAGGASYVWSPAADIVSGAGTAVVTVRPKASETFTVVVTNATGCATTQTISLNVGTLFPLVTSNIITPNGDGKNDTWIVKNIDYYPTSTVKVVDKAGKVVFTASGYQNDWAGTYNGQPLTQGTYYYVIDLGASAPKYTGYITLIRD